MMMLKFENVLLLEVFVQLESALLRRESSLRGLLFTHERRTARRFGYPYSCQSRFLQKIKQTQIKLAICRDKKNYFDNSDDKLHEHFFFKVGGMKPKFTRFRHEGLIITRTENE